MDLDFTNKKVLVTGAGKGMVLDFVYLSLFKELFLNLYKDRTENQNQDFWRWLVLVRYSIFVCLFVRI